MQISDKAIDAIRGNNKAIAGLMISFDICQKTVENWLDKRDIRFTTPTAIDAIKKSTGLSEKQIFEKQKAHA